MEKNCNNCGYIGDKYGVCATCLTENKPDSIPSNWTPVARIKHSVDDVNENEQIDSVNHPNHYQSKTGLEVIDVIDAFTHGLDGVLAFDTGNVIKYICRWKQKNGIEDLKKAKWYIEDLINHLEKEK